MSRVLLGVFSALLIALPAQDSAAKNRGSAPQEGDSSSVNPLPLASVLLKDGFPDRALQVLAEVDPADSELDTVRFYTLTGLAQQRQGHYEEALSAYEKAIEASEAPPVTREDGTVVDRSDIHHSTYLLMGQAAFKLEEFPRALEAFDRVDREEDIPAELYLFTLQCHWRMGNLEGAWEELEAGRDRFPNEREFTKVAVFLLSELALYRSAFEEAKTLLEGDDQEVLKPQESLRIAESMRKSGALEEAALFLESARLNDSEDANLIRLLGQVYIEQGRNFMAALLFEESARHDPEFLNDASELYRKAGKPSRALFLNERIPDQKEKMRQKLGILLELERFEEVAKMGPRLKRLGLLKEDDLLYAMAYAAFQSREFKQAERWIKKINDPKTYEMAISLREAIMNCRQEGWLCE